MPCVVEAAEDKSKKERRDCDGPNDDGDHDGVKEPTKSEGGVGATGKVGAGGKGWSNL